MSNNIEASTGQVNHGFLAKPAVLTSTPIKQAEQESKLEGSSQKTIDGSQKSEASISPSNILQGNVSQKVIEKQRAEAVFHTKSQTEEVSVEGVGEKITEEDITQALEVVSSFAGNAMKNVVFLQNEQAGKLVIMVTDKKTQEVISQFPNEKIVLMAEKIRSLHQEVQSISGLLIDSHV